MSTLVLSLVVAGLALVIVLLFGATLELHRQVFQLRQHAGLVDRSRVVDFRGDVLRSSLPAFEESYREPEQRSAILLLSDGCSTCHDVARGLPSPQHPALLVVLAARSFDSGSGWLAQVGLEQSQNILVDDGSAADDLGVSVSPVVVTFEGLYSVSAITVPSVRQLENTLEWLAGGRSPIRKELQ